MLLAEAACALTHLNNRQQNALHAVLSADCHDFAVEREPGWVVPARSTTRRCASEQRPAYSIPRCTRPSTREWAGDWPGPPTG